MVRRVDYQYNVGMTISLVKDSIAVTEVKKLAQESFGDMVKAVVDIEQGIMAVGGELHADAEAELLQAGSRQENLWGINIYPDRSGDEQIEFSSFINIRPTQGNRSMIVEDETTQQAIRQIIAKLIKAN